jgi:hypothetical protein
VLNYSVDMRARLPTITQNLMADSSMLQLISDRN